MGWSDLMACPHSGLCCGRARPQLPSPAPPKNLLLTSTIPCRAAPMTSVPIWDPSPKTWPIKFDTLDSFLLISKKREEKMSLQCLPKCFSHQRLSNRCSAQLSHSLCGYFCFAAITEHVTRYQNSHLFLNFLQESKHWM